MGSLAGLIDHSLLHPTLTDDKLREGCLLARRYAVASVCIKPYAVPLAVELLEGCGVKVGTVVGFPHGSTPTEIKVQEAQYACRHGATELDIVVNIGKVLSRDWRYVEEELMAILAVAAEHGALTKVIFENDLLPGDEFKIHLCEICSRIGADYVKTSTGFGFVKQSDGSYSYRGATEEDIALMRRHCQGGVNIKAAGGVRHYEDAVRMRSLGVTRIGATATEAILGGERQAGQPE